MKLRPTLISVYLQATLIFFAIILLSPQIVLASQVAITIDDPSSDKITNVSSIERASKTINILKKHNLHAALFVCGKRVDDKIGREILKQWNKAGHIIGNHSYSHLYYHSPNVSFDDYSKDISKGESIISKYKNFKKIYRFPFLKEGNSKDKRNRVRIYLESHGYKVGNVTIDASDWYIDERMKKRIAKDPDTNLEPYKEYYLNHIWDRAQFYDSLAKKILGRDVKHTLLIHDNLLTTLFLDDLIQMFKNKGWKIIDASDAFSDPLFRRKPDVMPAGESIVWSLAKESGKYDKLLRYPAEDGKYEEEKMNELGL